MNSSKKNKTTQSADFVTNRILIAGEQLSEEHQVKQILVEKEVNKIPTATLVILDGEVAKQDFELSNQEFLIPGKEIEIFMGYNSDDKRIFKGIIIKHSVKVRNNSSLLIVECKDEAVKMTVGRKSNYFYESSDSDIFETILESYGLERDVERTNFTHKQLVQYHVSDWDFLVSRAQANGKLCFLDDGKVTIKKPDVSQKAIDTITFGSNMLKFDAEIDARNQYHKVSSYSWNYTDQEISEIKANDLSIPLNGNLSPSDLAKTIALENLELRHGGALSDIELQDWADAKILFQQLAKVRGSVKFQGASGIAPGVILNLEGVGDRFNGAVYVTAVRHQIAEGDWTVDAQFGMNPRWFSETHEINSLPASGLLSSICGLQVGIVSQLQDDPDGDDRILVRLPIVDNEEQGIWCRIASLDAGKDRGFFFRPEIEDEVIVGFINDDPNDAIVLGMLHSSAKPAPLEASDENNEKGLVTRSGMKFIFDDAKKSIRIETPVGKVILLDEDAGSLVVEDENSNSITLDSSGITIASASDISIKATGDLKLEGKNVTIKADEQFKAEGSAGVEMSSSAITTVKGALVHIN